MRKNFNFVHCYSNEDCDVTILAEDSQLLRNSYLHEGESAVLTPLKYLTVDNNLLYFTKKNSLQSY